jgi:hypothetical protein
MLVSPFLSFERNDSQNASGHATTCKTTTAHGLGSLKKWSGRSNAAAEPGNGQAFNAIPRKQKPCQQRFSRNSPKMRENSGFAKISPHSRLARNQEIVRSRFAIREIAKEESPTRKWRRQCWLALLRRGSVGELCSHAGAWEQGQGRAKTLNVTSATQSTAV